LPRQIRVERTIELGARRVTYCYVRTVGRRAAHIIVDPVKGLEVRVPYHFEVTQAETLLREHQEWVLHQIARAKAIRPAPLTVGSMLPFLDEVVRITYVERVASRIRRVAGELQLSVSCTHEEALRACAERCYRDEARTYFARRLTHLAPHFGGQQPTRITVRAQRTRWGSCSSKGTISLNWRLMFLSTDVVDYVIAHELCHLTHLNHSREFWWLLSCGMPDWQDRRTRLAAATQAPL
jgi:predicted metal-dependent hydrolase